ncbi:MAG: ABC transporter permease [Gallionellales bacterium RIFCSPLOWO2_02_FULL_57_47]|nr:MAG: ABC transporter permease [Gallionellales bacterium RIFCSPLOWO2_02_FULL_57_47]OGT15111.1 MAG: ABC transporter permease [Gallionellales bacterium RIFCSPHIGHO2_02_FULL_57_16]
MNLLRLSLNLLRRDWRAGEWRVLLLALVLAVGSLATVGLFADRVRQALQQEAQSLIGADMRITSMRPLPPAYRAAAQTRGLQTAMSLSFPSMVVFGEQNLLSEIQLVEAGYPLRGKITIDDGSAHVAQDIPAPGTIWASQRLLHRLEIRLGDEVSIGRKRFVVAAAIVRDVDQSIGFASFAPRVLLNAKDLAATGLDQEGSRINYRLLIAGDARQVGELRDELKSKLTDYQKLEDVRDARPEIRTALDRAEHFLGLAALTAAILAGAAMALASRRFVLRHLDGCAVMRCLGAQQGQVLRLFLYQFLLLGIVAVMLGCALGYVTQAVLVGFIESMRDAELPQPTVLPTLKAAASGFALLLGFSFLPLLQLRKVSPLRVLRRELGAPQTSTGMVYGLAVLVLAGLFLWQAGSIELGFAMLGGLLAGLLLFGALARLLLHGLARYSSIFHPQLRHAFNNLARHGHDSALQVVALGLGGMALLLLTLVRGDLLQSWQGKLPPETPNRFVVNIQPDQQQPVLDFFARQSVPQPELLPMVRGRLVAINAAPIVGDNYPDPRARELVEREFNLSWAEQMPEWNDLVQGQWWDYRGQKTEDSGQKGVSRAQLSVEEGIAERLGIQLGDELTYEVAGSRFTARVTNLRKVQWDSMRVNFFVITTPELLRDYPVSYLTSFYLPPDKLRVGDQLTREFPTLLVIDTGALIAQVRSIMDQIAQTVSVVFLFTLSSGLAVLYAALLATLDERIRETAILRTLGADSRYLRRLHLGEFAALGLLSGLFAAGGAVLLGWVLARFVLEIPYHASTVIWPVGGLGGMLVVMLAGWLGTRRLSALPPLVILRE